MTQSSDANTANTGTDVRLTPLQPAQRRSIVAFLLLAFGGAWILWGYWVFAMPPGGLVITPVFIVCALAGGLAPSLAAIFVTARIEGGAALRQLLASVVRRTELRFVLLALFAIPLATALSVFIQLGVGLELRSPEPALLAMALVWPVMAALGEELGWRGFLLARLVPAWGLLPSALAIGLVWGLWHLPSDYIGLKAYGDLFWLVFLVNGPIVLTAHSIIVTWLWQKSGGSTLIALLYHWSVTASAIVAPVSAATDLRGVTSAAIGAGMIWLVALALMIARWSDFAASAKTPGQTQVSGL
jgi:membrane protease YdiL (CAAX protease family)